jgi:DNA-binding CsgD family transcriptional regulator
MHPEIGLSRLVGMAPDRAHSIDSLVRGESGSLDHLLLTLYRSVHAGKPWTEFLELLCKHFAACTATLVLRQPSRGDRGVLFDVNTRRSVVEVYRTQVFSDDPFRDLGEGNACNIFDRVSRESFLRSRFYNELLKLDSVRDILALNVTFGNTYLGSLKLSRRDPDDCFGAPEKALLNRLYPHIKLAMESYERSHREDLESNAYVRAIDQLAFGVIILNEREHVIRVNETAARILSDSKLLQIVGSEIHAGEPGHQALLAKALRSMYEAATADGRGTSSLKLTAGNAPPGTSANSLHLLLKPITAAAGGEGAGIAIFLSADNLQRNVAIEPFARLYHISRAEVALVTELLDGASIIEAASALGISENTARAQLRSVFSKTGTHRQPELTRVVLTSLAIIA